MAKTEINEIRKRTSTEGVNIADIQFSEEERKNLKPFEKEIIYTLNEKRGKLMKGEASLLIKTANNDKLWSILESIEGGKFGRAVGWIIPNAEDPGYMTWNATHQGKKAKDIATVLANNGINFEGIELLKEHNIGGQRTI